MAATPLESSSTPPGAATDPTRPQIDPMEDIDPQTTRKRPRLDSGSGVCESLSIDETSASRMSDRTAAAAPAAPEHEASLAEGRAARMPINTKNMALHDMTAESLERSDSEQEQSDTVVPDNSTDDPHASNVISISSSPVQSPQIEVAEPEDMDQDPNNSNWKPLGEALQDPVTPEIVQLQDRVALTDTFPRLHENASLRDNLEEICTLIEKGPSHDPSAFLAVKDWLHDCVCFVNRLTFDVWFEDRDFWDEFPCVVESLLRRVQDLQPDEGRGPWDCFQDFFLQYAELALHLVQQDTLALSQLADYPDLGMPDLMARPYLPALGWMLQLSTIPFYRTLERLYSSEVINLVARVNDEITEPPCNAITHLSEYVARIMTLIHKYPQLSSSLASAMNIVNNITESGNDRRRYRGDEDLIDSPVYLRAIKAIYPLVRAMDETFQAHITKKLPYVTNETGESMLRIISTTYVTLCQRDPTYTVQIPKDLSLELPEEADPDDLPSIIYYGWRFSVLKKYITDGRMELRVLGIETMQQDLVSVWRLHIQNNPRNTEHPVVQYLVKFLRDNKIVDYVVGIDSHPQLISRSGNIVGFLVVTYTYSDVDTDTIWNTVTHSQDPRTVSEVLSMLTKTFHMHPPSSPSLLYVCSKLLELPLNRFDARMVEFCEQLLHYVREKHERKRDESFEIVHVDAIPLQLGVRLIRESAAFDDFSVEHKALLQKFASSQLNQFIRIGLSEAEKTETYERCVQDIAEMNKFTVGSIQALNALSPAYDSQEIRKLATEFDLTRLAIAEFAHAVEVRQTDFTDSFSKTGFLSRIQILARIIDKVPESITAELGDVLWRKIFMSKELVEQGRRALWEMLCGLTHNSMKRNPFIERCIHELLPQLTPDEYSFEVLCLAKQAIVYEVRFNPPPPASENEVVTVPGMDRIWNFILTAPPGSIEADAAKFAIEVYLDHTLILRSPRSVVEATHIALVDRCIEQLKSAASELKSPKESRVNGESEPMVTSITEEQIRTQELRFSRSLLFLRQFLQGLRMRPQYSPPRGPPPNLPERPVKGDPIDISYQAFNGGSGSKISTMRIGDLSTASELVDRLVQLTGFSKFKTIYGGQRLELLEKPEMTLKDLKLRTGLLIIRKDVDSHEIASTGRRQSLTLVDSEVLKHFDEFYDLLGLEDHLAREIFDFLAVFPPQQRVVDLVKSEDKTEDDIFPMRKPYSLLYSVNALSSCLREEALEVSPNQEFVSHSIRVLVAALTRSEMSESFANSPTKILFAISLVECLLLALLVMPPLANNTSILSESAGLVRQLVQFMEIGQQLPFTHTAQFGLHKLICNSFAVLTEGSLRDSDFWGVIMDNVQLDRLIPMLLLSESRQAIRKQIAETINVACSPSKRPKKPGKAGQEDPQVAATSENPARIGILATIWDAFVKTMPQTLEYTQQCQEFFEAAGLVFRSVAEKSPRDLIFNEYLRQWSDIMLKHRSKEFVGREPVDYLILGFSRLLRSCLDVAESMNTSVDTFDLAENLFDSYLFPDLSNPSDTLMVPQIPVMHAQTRQELYNILTLLCKHDENYSKVVERLDDLIPSDVTYSPAWCFDRYKMIRSPEGYAGLKNLSNTCYLNSLLTQLFMNVGFRDFMLQLNVTDPQSSQRLLRETKKLFGNMQETWFKSVEPQGLVDSIRTYDNEQIDVTIQMDVDEFYNLLFDRWEAQIADPDAKKTFRSFYGGQLVQQIKSKECSHISERLEPFSAIQCDIKGKASLEESLEAYVEGEIMQGDNKYSCTSCGRHVDAVKRACLKEVPDNLIFHLKRFDFDMVTMMRNKINDEFRFPERIDMTPFKVEHLSDPNAQVAPDVFELVGVLVHSGTAESGHYYSYIRERPTAGSRGSWVEFNDSDVSRFEAFKIADQCFGGYNDSVHPGPMGQVRFNKVWNAYMLFYQRVSNMETEKSVYKPAGDVPIRVPLPLPLKNHITMENEIFIRTYCLLDPYHALFVRHLLGRLNEMKGLDGEKSRLEKSVIFIGLDTLEQLLSRCKEPLGLDPIIAELIRAITDTTKGAHRVLQWVADRPTGIRNLILKSPHASVRSSSIKVIVAALMKLKDLSDSAEIDSMEKEQWQNRYLDMFELVVATLEGLWSSLHAVSRAWDDYFEFLALLASIGPYEAGVLLNNGFLQKCLEIVWLDREDSKRLKRHYVAYSRLIEKGRRFSHLKLMELLAILLKNIDFTAPPSLEDERQTLPDGRYSLTAAECTFIRPLGRENELVFLKKLLQQYNNPQASRGIIGLLLDAEPEAGMMEPICKTLEDGLRVAPAELCAPFLDATIVFCCRSPEEVQILSFIDFVAKGVDSINNSGGKEHLAFFTSAIKLRNERLGLNEAWFLSSVMAKVPEWTPTLLIFPDRAVRSATLEILRQMLFSGTAEEMTDEWQSSVASIAKELVHACVDKLRKTYLTVAGQNVETRVVETMKTVIDHCLTTYYDDSEEDQEFVRQANAVCAAIDELSVDLPEELASESDLASPEDWEDNSMIASDSEMGLAGSP